MSRAVHSHELCADTIGASGAHVVCFACAHVVSRQERAADPRPPAANTTKTRTKRRANGKAKKESAAKTTKTTKKK